MNGQIKAICRYKGDAAQPYYPEVAEVGNDGADVVHLSDTPRLNLRVVEGAVKALYAGEDSSSTRLDGFGIDFAVMRI